MSSFKQSINNAKVLYRQSTNNTNIDTYKYQLSYDKYVQNPETNREWIELMERIAHQSGDFKLFIAKLNKKTPIVVKVGNKDKLKNEYELGKTLQKLYNFIDFFCYFECNNKLQNINVQKPLCNTVNPANVGILVMPDYALGRIDKYNWTRENFPILKNVLKHIVCSLLLAYENNKFIHRDTHLGNILLKHATNKNIKYKDNCIIDVNGILPVIMDFDRSIIDTENNQQHLVYLDISRIFSLIKSELDIKSTNEAILKKLDMYSRNFTPINEHMYKDLCDEIDRIQINFILSELRLQF